MWHLGGSSVRSKAGLAAKKLATDNSVQPSRQSRFCVHIDALAWARPVSWPSDWQNRRLSRLPC